jgi:hypothetical protein
MQRRSFGLAVLAAPLMPALAMAQSPVPPGPPAGAPGPRAGAAPRRGPQAPDARHDQVLGQDFDSLPPGARDRVTQAFRSGSPDLDEAGVRQRWNAMTPDQRGETLTMRERTTQRGGGARGPGGGAGPGAGPGTGAGRGPAAPRGQARPPAPG